MILIVNLKKKTVVNYTYTNAKGRRGKSEKNMPSTESNSVEAESRQ